MLEPTRTTMLAQTVLAETGEKYDVSDAVYLVDGAESLQTTSCPMGYKFRYEKHENRYACNYRI